jgi:hypothetical protein
VRPVHVFAGLLFQILDDGSARKLDRRPERKTDCAQNAEPERRAQHRRIGSAQPDDVHWQNFAERGHEQIGRPEAEDQPAHAPEQREEEAFREKLPDDAVAAAAERQTNRDLFPPRRAARQEHVRQVQTGNEQDHGRHRGQ